MEVKKVAPKSNVPVYVTPEQMAYATLLDHGMKAGFLLLVGTFALYVLGVVPPLVPMEELPKYWSMPVGDYLTAVGASTGWSWVSLVHRGDFLNFVGIAFLSGVTIVCYLRILPFSLKDKDVIFTSVTVLEVLVLVLGASGVLAAAH